MQIIIDEKRLEQLALYINEMPTKYGFPLAAILNQWKYEAENPTPDTAPDPAPTDANGDSLEV